VQTSIPIISYVTIMEGFQHVLGSGAGFIILFDAHASLYLLVPACLSARLSQLA
jgi:hypothetical protein